MNICTRCIPGLVIILFVMCGCGPQLTEPVATEEGDPDLYFVRGYRSDSDPCKLTGESGFTNRYLDDAADLVTCPSDYEGAGEFVKETGGVVVAQTKSYTLYTVRRR